MVEPSLPVARVALRLAPALAALACLTPALSAGFVHDDGSQILANPWLRDLAHLPTLWTTSVWSGLGADSSWYRPLMMTSFALDHALFGWSAPAMHAVSLALFAGVAVTAARLVARVQGDGPASLVAGLGVAVHPANVEAAVWVSARCELIACLAGLLALVLHARALDAPPDRRAAMHAGGGLALLAALLGKESAVGFVLVLPVLDVVRGASLQPSALLRRHAASAVALAVYALLRTQALGSTAGGLAAPVDVTQAIAFAGQGMARILWPVGLTIASPAPGPFHAWLGAAGLLGIAGGLGWALRRRSPLAVPLALGGAQLAIAALGSARLGELADRYLLGVVVAASWGAGVIASRLWRVAPLPVQAATALVLVALAAGAHGHARSFRSDATLWAEAARRNPASARAAMNLAAALLAEDRPLEAIPWLDRAEVLAPGDPVVAIDRAVAEAQTGDVAGARRRLESLLEARPADPRVHLALGHLALDQQQAALAERHYRAVLALLPEHAEAWAGLGVALAASGQGRDAREALERALELDPEVQNAARLRGLVAELPARAPRPESPR